MCSDEHHQGTATSPTPLKARRRAPRRDIKSACDLTNKTQISLSPAFQLTDHSSQQQQGIDPAAPNEHDAGGSRTESTLLLFPLESMFPVLREVAEARQTNGTSLIQRTDDVGSYPRTEQEKQVLDAMLRLRALKRTDDEIGPTIHTAQEVHRWTLRATTRPTTGLRGYRVDVTAKPPDGSAWLHSSAAVERHMNALAAAAAAADQGGGRL